jgi:glycosyltransferase involved in cell wall biosynthesis
VERLRLAVDGTPLLGVRTGVGVFTSCALGALAARPDLDVRAFAVSWRRRRGIAGHLPPGVGFVDRAMPARPLHYAWGRVEAPTLEWWTGPLDVVHGTNFVVPPTRHAARVVTVHDLTTVHFPALCDAATLRYPALVKRALAHGAWVHTPSRFVAAEVVEVLGADPDRVRAVHHGVPPVAADREADGEADGDEAEAGAPAADGPGDPFADLFPSRPYVLALGTVEPRKDLPSLVRAFDAIAGDRPDLQLVVAGPDGWGVGAFHAGGEGARHRERVRRLGWLGGRDRDRLLRGAHVFAYPSLYEGFGLPPLEAMAAGVPVVTTTAGAVPEVVGDAAELAPVGDVDALAEALARVVDDTELRGRLVERGRSRAAAFSWEACGQGLAALYRDAAAASPRRS